MERLLVGFAVVMMGGGFIIGNVDQVELSTLGIVMFFLGSIFLVWGFAKK